MAVSVLEWQSKQISQKTGVSVGVLRNHGFEQRESTTETCLVKLFEGFDFGFLGDNHFNMESAHFRLSI